MLVVPEGFAEAMRRRGGAGGARWVAQLPSVVEHLMRVWALLPEGPVLHGDAAIVVPVRCADGPPAAVKVSWMDEESSQEGVALGRARGCGAASP